MNGAKFVDIACRECSKHPRGMCAADDNNAPPEQEVHREWRPASNVLSVNSCMDALHCKSCDRYTCTVCYTKTACNIVPPFGRTCEDCCHALQSNELKTHPSIHSRVLKNAAARRIKDVSTSSSESREDICSSPLIKERFPDTPHRVCRMPGYVVDGTRHYTNARGQTVYDARGWCLIQLCSRLTMHDHMDLFYQVVGREADDYDGATNREAREDIVETMVDCMWPVVDRLHSVMSFARREIVFYSSHLMLSNLLELPVREETIVMERMLINEQRMLNDLYNSGDTYTTKDIASILSHTRGNIYAMERRLLWARDHTQQWNKLSDDYIHEAFTTTQQENARKCNRINNSRKKPKLATLD